MSTTSTPATSSDCSSRRIAQRSKRTGRTVRRFHRKPDADSCVGLSISLSLGATKPDPTAFLAALKLFDARPQQTFFVDDNPINVLGARQLGIRGAQANKAADVESALRSVGLLQTH
ncbi:HAD-IA family hydrolase [Rhodococcus sp. NPDC059969]|uniref:HAD-IA family hydrolase n=1 Tax=Rhodococcus sp. NPDC059969 TaxID=3347018 RepID=UPI00366E11E4